MAFDTEKYTKNPFIKGDDLEEGERYVYTITEADEVTFPQSGDTVPVLSFKETDQKLTLNKTRIKKLVDLFGPDTDSWVGSKISIYQIDVQFGGKTTAGVAIAAAPKGKQGKMQPEVEFSKTKVEEMEEEEYPV